MLREVDGDRVDDCGVVLDQVVERVAPHTGLESVDHGEAAVVAHDHDHLVPVNDRAVDVAVEHHVRAVTNEDHDVFVGHGHRRAPTAAGLITHAAKAVLTIEAVEMLGAPTVVYLTGESTRSSESERLLVGHSIDRTYDLGVRWQAAIAGRFLRCDLVDVGVVLSNFGGHSGRPRVGRTVTPERCGHLCEGDLGVAGERDRLALCGIEACRVEADDLHRVVLEDSPRTGREIEKTGTDSQHHVGLACECVRRRSTGHADRAAIHRVVPFKACLSSDGLNDGDVVGRCEGHQFGFGQAVMHSTTRHDERLLCTLQ